MRMLYIRFSKAVQRFTDQVIMSNSNNIQMSQDLNEQYVIDSIVKSVALLELWKSSSEELFKTKFV